MVGELFFGGRVLLVVVVGLLGCCVGRVWFLAHKG